jgi:hypothetical protein
MKRSVYYIIVSVVLFLLMLIAFRLPINVYHDVHYDQGQDFSNVRYIGTLRLLMFIGIGVLSYFMIKTTPEDEDPKSLNWPLLSIVGVFAANSVAMLIIGIVRSVRDYEFFDYTLGFSPFYALFITGLAGAFYVYRDPLYLFLSSKIDPLADKIRNRKSSSEE